MAQLIDSSMLQTKLDTKIPSSHTQKVYSFILLNRARTGGMHNGGHYVEPTGSGHCAKRIQIKYSFYYLDNQEK